MKREKEIKVVHETIDLPVSYDVFTRRFEGLLGRFDPEVERLPSHDATEAAHRIESMEGEQGLMLFGSQNHGALFAMRGETRKAKRYHVGNPLVAFQMTGHDIRAGLYAPISMFVYEAGPATVCVEFDRPSSLIGQFGDQEVTDVARDLDAKVEALIRKAAAQPGA
jgi:hypothetical protein